MVVLGLALMATTTACSGSGPHRDSSPQVHPSPSLHLPTAAVDDDERDDSISSLVAGTDVAVVATARSLVANRSAPSDRPGSLVTLDVTDVIRGTVGGRIVVAELGGRPGAVVPGAIAIKVGQSYLLCLGRPSKNGPFSVVGGTTGLFGYNPRTQEVTRLDPNATQIPSSFSLANARLALGQFPTPFGKTCDPLLQLAADSSSVVAGTIESIEPYTTGPQVESVLVDQPTAIGGTGSFPPEYLPLVDIGSGPGQVPLVVGHSVLMFLAAGPSIDGTATTEVVNGLEGLFGFDPNTLTAARLDNQVTGIPASLSWTEVKTLMEPSPPNAKNPCLSPPDATTTTIGPPSTNTPPVPVPTIVIDPDTYRPSYDTIDSLFADSGLVFVATAQPLQSDPSDGEYEAFPLNQVWIVDALGTPPRVTDLDLPQGRPGDVPLVVGRTYLIFYGTDATANYANCVVGGLRGIFNYDAVTGMVSRIDTNARSQIPETQPIGQLAADLLAYSSMNGRPMDSPSPPICSRAVTGL
jgi:hypothetical protein